MSSSVYELFETNKDVEKSGIILDYGKFKFTVARAGGANKKFAKLLEVKRKPYQRVLATGTIDPEVATQIMREVYAESVVLGWEGVTDRKGKDLPFTAKNCVQLFQDLPDLFEDIMEQAQKAALFREHIREEEAKNS